MAFPFYNIETLHLSYVCRAGGSVPQSLVLNLDSVSQGGVALPAIPFFFVSVKTQTVESCPLQRCPTLGVLPCVWPLSAVKASSSLNQTPHSFFYLPVCISIPSVDLFVLAPVCGSVAV